MKVFFQSCLRRLLAISSLISLVVAVENATFSPWLTADFSFSWTPSNESLSIPATAQCDTINIIWKQLNNGSPDPVAPYYLQIYSSNLTYPIIVNAGELNQFSWVVPFPPDTIYQICMFDSKGNTGGCQDAYVVTPPRNASHSCTSDFGVPSTLSVQGSTENGPLTQYGWPDQCTTVSLNAHNGTPPFIMTVAPSLHPPLNLTFDNFGHMSWTITLGWAMQFWISLVDSKGALWTYGPLHSGGNGPTDCLHLAGNSLNVQPSMPSSQSLPPGKVVGIAIASAIFGMLLILATQWVFGQRNGRRPTTDLGDGVIQVHPTPGVEPYHVDLARSQSHVLIPNTEASTRQLQRNDSQVYVVHHDAGGIPVTIYTGGRDVEELPPHYIPTSPEPSTRPTHTPSTSMDSNAPSSGNEVRRKPSAPLRACTD